MHHHTLFAAAAGFDAARRLQRLHGHGFGVQVDCALPPEWAPFPGGEAVRLREHLASSIAPLEGGLLNDHVDEPGDDRLARWLLERLDLPGLQRLRLRSGRRQGVEIDAAGKATAWRRYRFQSAHWLPHVPAGHKCGRLHGHGFEAVVQAGCDADGSAAAYERLDEAWAPLHAELNYHCLNELPGLDNPTSELLSSWIWQRLHPLLPGLAGVTVYETASCGARYDGRRHRIWKDFTLDSALQYRRAPKDHPLHRVHGATCTLRLQLWAPLDQVLGWAVDFGDVKSLFTPVFNALDHQPLHQLPALADADPASVAAWVLDQARARLPQAEQVALYETPGCGAIVSREA